MVLPQVATAAGMKARHFKKDVIHHATLNCRTNGVSWITASLATTASESGDTGLGEAKGTGNGSKKGGV